MSRYLQVLVMCFFASVIHAQTMSEDERAIRTLIAEHAAASQIGDFDGLVAGYRDDSDLRWVDGALTEGISAIQRRYKEVLNHGNQGMAHRHPKETIRIRFLREDIAFADIDSVAGVMGEVDKPEQGQTRTPFFVVFTKVGGEWGVAIERQGSPIR